MKSNFSVNKEFLLKTAKEILEFNSPTGFCFEIMDKIEAIIKPFGPFSILLYEHKLLYKVIFY